MSKYIRWLLVGGTAQAWQSIMYLTITAIDIVLQAGPEYTAFQLWCITYIVESF